MGLRQLFSRDQGQSECDWLVCRVASQSNVPGGKQGLEHQISLTNTLNLSSQTSIRK
jgi:hypothetical protein